MKTAFKSGLILILLSFLTLVPAPAQTADCPTLYSGDLFKVPNNTAVYYVNDDLKRLYFPTSDVFHSWYDDFSSVIEIPNVCVDNHPAPSSPPYGVNYRPGAKLVKVKISPTVYAVEPDNKLRKIGSEAVARDLYGNNWASLVRDIADAFWPNYPNRGGDITESIPHDGMFVKSANSATYYVRNSQLQELDYTPRGDIRTVSNEVLNRLSIKNTTIMMNTIYYKLGQSITEIGNRQIILEAK